MRSSSGFTLVELSIAFIIIVLLLAGAMIPLSTQIELRSVADTQRSMEQIREALIGFAQVQGRLPCPAAGNIAAGGAGAGTEQTTGNRCTFAVGVIPWAALGVPETDAWGRRFTYRVSPAFSDTNAANTWATALATTPNSPADQVPACAAPVPLPAAPTSFALCTLGDIAVFTRGATVTTATALGAALAAVIVSHGRNGFGAWQSNGTQLGPLPPVNTDENRNLSGQTAATPAGGYSSRAFYSRSPTPAAAGCADPAPPNPGVAPACEFDDIVVMIPSQVLISRMVAAGRLP
jgi:type II secretory pathway pseudopilin PulG